MLDEDAGNAQKAAWNDKKVVGLRYRLGLSQAEFSKRLGVRQQTVSDWETGQHTPKGASVRMLSMLAEQAAAYRTKPIKGRRKAEDEA
jgi:DNA-binding transcriptional regulator YiaG